MASDSPAGVSPVSQQSLLEEASPGRKFCRKLGWASAALGVVTVLALSLIYSAPAVPKAAGGVHYGTKRPATGSGQHEPVMTGPSPSAHGIHYLIRGNIAGPVPTAGPMTPAYKEIAELASEDLLFVRWLAAAGDIVHAGDPLLVFNKDGDQLQLKASTSGQIKELVDAAEGKVLSKGSKIAIFGHPPPQLPFTISLRSSLFGSIFLLLVSLLFVAILLSGLALTLTPTDSSNYTKVTSPEDGFASAADVPSAFYRADLISSSAQAAAGLSAFVQAPVYARAPTGGEYLAKSASGNAAVVPRGPVSTSGIMQPSAALLPPAAKKDDDSSPKLPRLSRAAAQAAAQE